MTQAEFEFNLSQIQSVITHSRKRFRSNNRRATYKNLIELYEAVQANYDSYDHKQLKQCSDIVLTSIYLGVESLDYKYIWSLPKNLIKSLELCLDDWVENHKKQYSIVFSHNSRNLRDIFIQQSYKQHIDKINWLCKSVFKLGVGYNHGLIQINQPKYFNKDYLSSIPCYHELGHFIEAYYSIPYYFLSTGFIYESDSLKLDGSSSNRETQHRLFRYISEHFADLFAAQYLGDVMCDVLDYVAEGNEFSPTHPSTEKRKSVIYTFLQGTGSLQDLSLVNEIKNATVIQTKRRNGAGGEIELKNRMIDLSIDPFIEDRPIKLSKNEIHGLYSSGWRNYIRSTVFSAKYDNYHKRLDRINKLIKKSINKSLQ